MTTLRKRSKGARARSASGFVAVALFGCHAPAPLVAPPESAASPATAASPAARGSAVEDTPEERVPEESLLDRPLCLDDTELCRDVARGEGFLAEGRGKEAELLFAELALRHPERPEVRVGLARALSRSESLAFGTGGEGARQALAALESLPASAQGATVVRLERARLELCLGRAERARELLLRLRRELPSEPEVQGALGVALLAEGRVRESLEPLGRAVVLDPRDVERRLVLGSARMLVEDLEGAEEAFRGAIALAPDSAKGHADLGALLLLRGRADEGGAHLERSLALGGERATLLTNLAYAALLGKDFEGARARAARATELDASFGSAWLNLGLAEAALGNFEAARAAFRRAQELDPDDPRVAPNLAELDELEQAAR